MEEGRRRVECQTSGSFYLFPVAFMFDVLKVGEVHVMLQIS